MLIVARGGGSIEDLWAFNEEAVLRAAAEGTIPLISAVGHETDTTLIDFVSDRRAPTPTGAAEMAVPVRADLVAEIRDLGGRGHDAMERRLARETRDLRALVRAMPPADAVLAAKRQRLDLAEARLMPGLAGNARVHRARFARLAERAGRHPPALALAMAQGRLRLVADKPGAALRFGALRKRESLAHLSRRLTLARDATLRRTRAETARDGDRLAALALRLSGAATRFGERRRDRLTALAGLLGSLSYRSVLARGFALVRDEAGASVHGATTLREAQRLVLEFSDGSIGVVTDGGGIRPLEAASSTPRKPARTRPKRIEAAPQGSLFEV